MTSLPPRGEVTALLRRVADGDEEAGADLYALLYEHLRVLAESQTPGSNGDTLQPTALVHEAWLRLTRSSNTSWRDREHFLAVASRAMRCALVDHVRRRRSAKRGGDSKRVQLDEAVRLFERSALDLLALDEALEALARHDERQARVVELRFFGGMSFPEISRSLAVSQTTAERSWQIARAFLRDRLER